MAGYDDNSREVINTDRTEKREKINRSILWKYEENMNDTFIHVLRNAE